MGVWARLQSGDKKTLHTETVGDHTHLVIEDHARVATQFKVAATTSAATTIIVRPRPGAALVITDFIANQDKVASGDLILRFHDGTNVEIFFKSSTADAQVIIAHGFVGRMFGWRDARVEMISAGTNPTTNVTIVYYHLPESATFAEWDAAR